MILSDAKRWSIKDLQDWLKDPATMEDCNIEFKSQLPSGNTHGKQKLRETFCAFANNKGGLVFFGINNDKSIRGILYDGEFKTKLGQIVNSEVMPITNWDVVNTLAMQEDLNIYIVAIFESPYFNKPHITNERVLIRYSGENRAIKDGMTLRRMLELEKFSAHCIESLEKEAEKMNTLKFNPQELDFMYLLQLRQYLEQKANINDEFKSLLNDFRNIMDLYFQVKHQKTTQSITAGEGGNILEDQNFTNKINELNAATRDFITSYKKVHGL